MVAHVRETLLPLVLVVVHVGPAPLGLIAHRTGMVTVFVYRDDFQLTVCTRHSGINPSLSPTATSSFCINAVESQMVVVGHYI